MVDEPHSCPETALFPQVTATVPDPLVGLTIKDNHLARVLRGQDFLVQDGAMGTMLQARGLAEGGRAPDVLCIENPEAIIDIHRAYVQAGAEMVTTNTFGANARKLAEQFTVAQVYQAAADCARAAGARYVAGDIGPSGALLEPLGTFSFEEAYHLFAEQVCAAVDAGCDLIVIETMADLREAKAAVLAAREHSTLPIFVTMTFGEDGRTFMGTTPEIAALTLSSLNVQAVGVNCSLGPDQLVDAVLAMAQVTRCPVVARPNAGLPHIQNGHTVFDVEPEVFAQAMEGMVDAGANVVGGCCGTTPAFIEQLSALVAGRVPKPRSYHATFAVTSAQQAVILPEGQASVTVIGERINPTGKPHLKEALRAGDFDYVVGEAVSQQEAGADVLDVNVGLPELDEPETLRAVVEKLQATVTVPLQVDSSDPQAIEAAVRGYAGKPLVNSVNGKRTSLETVLPIVRRYGCAVVGLTLDEDGIPPTAEGRYAIATRIVNAAVAQGIPKCDVAIDCLVMAAATNQDEAREILHAVALVKKRLGVRTILGVSNVSFGLPHRDLMNATFLAAALGSGLDMPILNPLSARYRDVVAAFRVLNGQDRNATNYIEAYAQAEDPYKVVKTVHEERWCKPETSGIAPSSSSTEQVAASANAKVSSNGDDSSIPLSSALADAAQEVRDMVHFILTGRVEPMTQATRALLETHDALDVVNGVFVPALDVVSLKYDRGEFFLPQLMASAESVKAGFDVVRSQQRQSTEKVSGLDNRVIAVATVQGDIHDIGKNIVKMLLENYGFTVIDLGRDVAPEAVVAAVKEHNIRLVGLSALMTTTVKAMERTIHLIHEQVPDTAVMVGGAVLTPEYAHQMGADYYSKDASASARIATEFFS